MVYMCVCNASWDILLRYLIKSVCISREGYDTRLLLKWNKASFNLEFFPYSGPVAMPKLKNPVCPSIYSELWGESK